ncbi:biopolymer transporter ExbD [Hyphomonas sp.]|uniref:ExbD/TolR family protein n=1 Tax=Hyphomonas sp. TaxID=87 RepID=UPI000DF984C8|nr:biopolymer transporter ExbD [Hyphomonas sp.]RCL89625.1 MAG: biopolymer transporter ExbD [Hyphomonas sp.]
MKRSKLQTRRDPVISLINIVFLILIFFMIAGTLASPPDPSVRFVQTQDLECCVPPDAVSIDKTGQLRRGGAPVSLESLLDSPAADTSSLRLLPDRELPAVQLLKLVKELRASGRTNIIVVTEHTTG